MQPIKIKIGRSTKEYTEALNELLESDDKFGFIVMDGNGALFVTLSGNTREVLHRFTVDIPKKHGRGGQSALRFARLRMEKRHNYVHKTAELSTRFFINPVTSQPNVAGLILAGSADFKTELSQLTCLINDSKPRYLMWLMFLMVARIYSTKLSSYLLKF
jgi:peptide subunit release factor 1 (eRF1)